MVLSPPRDGVTALCSASCLCVISTGMASRRLSRVFPWIWKSQGPVSMAGRHGHPVVFPHTTPRTGATTHPRCISHRHRKIRPRRRSAPSGAPSRFTTHWGPDSHVQNLRTIRRQHGQPTATYTRPGTHQPPTMRVRVSAAEKPWRGCHASILRASGRLVIYSHPAAFSPLATSPWFPLLPHSSSSPPLSPPAGAQHPSNPTLPSTLLKSETAQWRP
jgi:hypothetical protein